RRPATTLPPPPSHPQPSWNPIPVFDVDVDGLTSTSTSTYECEHELRLVLRRAWLGPRFGPDAAGRSEQVVADRQRLSRHGDGLLQRRRQLRQLAGGRERVHVA